MPSITHNIKNKDLNTIARWHSSNLKKANIPHKQKRIIDCMISILHEIGHDIDLRQIPTIDEIKGTKKIPKGI